MTLIFFLQNYPLYIRSVPTQNELKFHYTVHTSLDVVEEKISSVGKALADQRELYLGLLYPTEDYKVYPLTKPCMQFTDHVKYIFGPVQTCHLHASWVIRSAERQLYVQM